MRNTFCFSLFAIKAFRKLLALCLMKSYMVLFFVVPLWSNFWFKKVLWEWRFWFGLGLDWRVWLLNLYSYKEPFLARKDGYKKLIWEWKFGSNLRPNWNTLDRSITHYSESLGHTLFVRIFCFLLFNNRKSFENAAKSAFSIKWMHKIELFQLLSLE